MQVTEGSVGYGLETVLCLAMDQSVSIYLDRVIGRCVAGEF